MYIIYFVLADKVTVDGVNLEYCPMRLGFDEYAEDCWTYDGRLDQ